MRGLYVHEFSKHPDISFEGAPPSRKITIPTKLPDNNVLYSAVPIATTTGTEKLFSKIEVKQAELPDASKRA